MKLDICSQKTLSDVAELSVSSSEILCERIRKLCHLQVAAEHKDLYSQLDLSYSL